MRQRGVRSSGSGLQTRVSRFLPRRIVSLRINNHYGVNGLMDSSRRDGERRQTRPRHVGFGTCRYGWKAETWPIPRSHGSSVAEGSWSRVCVDCGCGIGGLDRACRRAEDDGCASMTGWLREGVVLCGCSSIRNTTTGGSGCALYEDICLLL